MGRAAALCAGALAMPAALASRATAGDFAVLLEEQARAWTLPSALAGWRLPDGTAGRFEWRHEDAAVGMTADTAYPVGSVGKLVAGLVVREALAAQRVPVDAIIPPWPADSTWAGLLDSSTRWEQLAMHTAGLPEPIAHAPFQSAVAAEPQRRWRVEELADVARAMPRRGAPGERFAYSNLHTVMLARAVERLAGEPFAKTAQAVLKRRLGAQAAHWSIPASMAWRDGGLRAWRHARPGRPLGYGDVLTDVTAYNPSWAGEGGDWSATLDGLLALGERLARSPQAWLGAGEAVWIPDAPQSGEAYGFHVMRRGDWLGHGGDVPGFSCALWARPADGTVVAAMVPLSNTRDGQQPADRLAQRVMDAIPRSG